MFPLVLTPHSGMPIQRTCTVRSCIFRLYLPIHVLCTDMHGKKVKVKVHPCTGTEVLYRLYDP